MDDDLIQRTATWFGGVRARVAELYQRAGEPLSVEIELPTVELGDDWPSGWSGATSSVEVSAMFNPASKSQIVEQLPLILEAGSGPIAEALAERCRATLAFSRGPVRSYRDAVEAVESAPARFVQEAYLVPAVTSYLQRLQTLATDAHGLAEEIARDLVEFAASESISYLTTIPVAGFPLETDGLSASAVRVRRLNPEEAGAHMLGDRTGMSRLPRSDFPAPLRWALTPATHAVELVVTKGKDERQGYEGIPGYRLVLALGLLGFRLSGPGASFTTPTPRWAHGWSTSLPVPLAPERAAEITSISAAELEEALGLADALVGMEVRTKPTTSREVAIHRFALALGRSNPADRLLDAVTALEALLLPSTDAGEFSFKFRLHGALFVGETTEGRREAFDALRVVYGVRSKLVHGSRKPPAPQDLAKAAKVAVDLAGVALTRALREFWPSDDDFVAMALAVDGSGRGPSPE